MLASVLDDHWCIQSVDKSARRLVVTMWRKKGFPVQGLQNSVIFLRPQFLILTNIIQLVLLVGIVESLCLIYHLLQSLGEGDCLCSVTVEWFTAMRSWSMESSVRCFKTQMSKTTVNICSPLNAESRFVHLAAFFCLLGQKKGSEYSHSTCCGWPLILHKTFNLPLALTEQQQQAE